MTDIKLSKTQISKINQFSGCLGFCLGNLGKKLITDLAIPITRDNFPGLVSNIISNKINKYERKISEKRTVRAGKEFTSFTLNGDMNDIIKIIKSLEDSGV